MKTEIEELQPPFTDAELRKKLIRRRAYQLYQEHGSADGHEIEDWLEAETEVLEAECAR